MKRSCLPQPLDGLGQPDVVGLVLVQADADGHGGQAQAPPEEGAHARQALGGDVVDDAGPGSRCKISAWEAASGGLAHWKPMCVWTSSVPQSSASVMGFNEPPMKGATVKGTRPSATSLTGILSQLLPLVESLPGGASVSNLSNAQ